MKALVNTVSDVAEHFNISLSHCSRLIKALTGKKFTELIRDIRLRHAQSIIASSNVKISSKLEIISLQIA